MKTIIAPINFSSESYNTGLYAAKMAQHIGAELVLLHVTELPLTVAEFPLSKEVFDSLNMEDELNHLSDRLRKETDDHLSISSKNIVGSLEYELASFCDQKRPFTIIMNTHNYTMLQTAFSQSAAVYSIKHLNWPVLIIPQGLKYEPIKKIALASDLKDIYSVPVDKIEDLVNCFKAELEVFFVGKSQNLLDGTALGSVMLHRRMVDLDPRLYFTEDKDILEGVTKLAEEHAIDMLIIIPKKHGLFHKSASKEFIRNSPIPVMAIHEMTEPLN